MATALLLLTSSLTFLCQPIPPFGPEPLLGIRDAWATRFHIGHFPEFFELCSSISTSDFVDEFHHVPRQVGLKFDPFAGCGMDEPQPGGV